MNRLPFLLALAFVTPVLAGCISTADDPGTVTTVQDTTSLVDTLASVAFSEKVLIDDVRAGGEPVIAVSHDGTLLVSSHPGWTHYHPNDDPTDPGTELITPFNAQSYLWRSTDGGDTWAHVGLPGLEEGPRSTGFGVSDPEFTVMEDGTICYTDLEGLAMSSVSCSTDDGETWVGNPIASQRPNDRQWLASYGEELYFTANYFTDHDLIVSTDRGITWERRGHVPCSYDLVADPADGTLIVGCSDGIAVSTDGGHTWERKDAGVDAVRRDMTEPAIDATGTVWMAWPVHADGDERTGEHIVVKGTDDHGETWPHTIRLDAAADDVVWADEARPNIGSAHVWPWVSAGGDGRLAVSWIGSPAEGAKTTEANDWHVYSALLLDATTDAPKVRLVDASGGPVHSAAICQSGTVCQVDSMQGDPEGDRRLGDFFETTIDHEGRLHIVVSDTVTKPDDVVSHVAYMRLDTTWLLLESGDRIPTQG